jgi:hypothetical protein
LWPGFAGQEKPPEIVPINHLIPAKHPGITDLVSELVRRLRAGGKPVSMAELDSGCARTTILQSGKLFSDNPCVDVVIRISSQRKHFQDQF